MSKLIIEGNAIYEIDEDCMRRRGKCQESENPKEKEADPLDNRKKQIKRGPR